MQEGITRLGPYRANWNSVFAVLTLLSTLRRTKTARIFLEDSPARSKPVALLTINNANRAEELAEIHSTTLAVSIDQIVRGHSMQARLFFPDGTEIEVRRTEPGGIFDRPEIHGLVVKFAHLDD